MKSGFIDLTHALEDNAPVFDGDPSTMITQIKDIKEEGYNLFRIETCFHVGTHVDFPSHFIENGSKAMDYPVDRFSGKGILIDFERALEQNYPDDGHTLQLDFDIDKLDLNDKVVVVKTGHYSKFGSDGYFEDYPILSEEFAQVMIDKKIRLLVIDMPSPDRSPFKVHKVLLNAGIPIVENAAHLDKLAMAEEFEIFAFPLKVDAEASLTRLVAKVSV